MCVSDEIDLKNFVGIVTAKRERERENKSIRENSFDTIDSFVNQRKTFVHIARIYQSILRPQDRDILYQTLTLYKVSYERKYRDRRILCIEVER